ncbi:hypothetical protein CYLTODRAFT_475542 [Cylindrobasidium torrendii FP15055 ss-10]|uniref:Uncharacterized protein n=1 Tax=Cylindrobasidium torrendii FP15055 ss-10 TaxID=1314674 RepID=A0A0D7AUK7_9AGAR|nr:hypothetical protein CYLTODRAFT_475542 [Cylindrobasidium torrendii FP15055 ss-10]
MTAGQGLFLLLVLPRQLRILNRTQFYSQPRVLLIAYRSSQRAKSELKAALEEGYSLTPMPSPVLKVTPMKARTSIGQWSSNGSGSFTNPLLRTPQSPTKVFVSVKDIHDNYSPAQIQRQPLLIPSSPTASAADYDEELMEERVEQHRGGGKTRAGHSLKLFNPRFADESEEEENEKVEDTEDEDFEDGDEGHSSDEEYVPVGRTKKARRDTTYEDSDGDDYIPAPRKPLKSSAPRKAVARKGKAQKKPSKPMGKGTRPTAAPRKVIKRTLSTASLDVFDDIEHKKPRVADSEIGTSGSEVRTVFDAPEATAVSGSEGTPDTGDGEDTDTLDESAEEIVWKFMPEDSPDRILNLKSGIKITEKLIEAFKEHFASGGDIARMRPTSECAEVPEFKPKQVAVPKVAGLRIFSPSPEDIIRATAAYPILSIRALEQGHFKLLFHRKGADKKWVCPHGCKDYTGRLTGRLTGRPTLWDHIEKCPKIFNFQHIAAKLNLHQD